MRTIVAFTIALIVSITGTTSSATAQTTSTPPATRVLQPEDVSSFAGTWEGWAQFPGGTRFSISRTIKADGTFRTVSQPGISTGRLWISDGKILYETGNSTGTMTLREEGGKRILSWQGPSRDGRGTISGEMAQQ